MTKRIRFVETVIYETEGYQKGPQYKEGSVHDFEDHFADRWLRRNKAVEVNTREPLAEDAPVEPIPAADPPVVEPVAEPVAAKPETKAEEAPKVEEKPKAEAKPVEKAADPKRSRLGIRGKT